MSTCRNLEVAGSRGRGRPRRTWRARLDGDSKDMGLRPEMATNRGGVASWGERLTRISAETTDVKRVVVVVAMHLKCEISLENCLCFAVIRFSKNRLSFTQKLC